MKKIPLFISVFLPIILFMGLFYSISVTTFYTQAEHQYRLDTNKALISTLQYARSLISERWQTEPRPLGQTYKNKKSYVARTISKELSLFSLPSTSGLMVIDTAGRRVIETYPKKSRRLKYADIQNHLHHKTSRIKPFSLPSPQGGYAVITYFAPLDVHLVAYDRLSFESSSLYESVKSWGYLTLPIMVMFIAAILVLICLRAFITPIQKLIKILVEAIQKDDFKTRIPLSGSSEMQSLSEQINTLFTYINKRDDILAKHADYLEDLVKERTRDLQSTQQQLVRHERLAAVGEFASSIAHELRNPLASIKIGVEKLEKLATLPNDLKRTALVKKEILRLENMLTGILSFTANRPNTTEILEAGEVIEQAIPSIESFRADQNLSLKIIGKKSRTKIAIDKNKTMQAILNVAKNAFDAAPPESMITITLHETDKDFCIDVHNEGDPIPSGITSRLFEPFYTTKSGGTGLGLPTTKRILEEMGGNITLRTEHNYGTCFSIHLPLA
ncbi:MAG: ATP-binding protein [Alphaproteobacteria bacterium]|nr:ATP-binding protein [Alphaproteobacteria bacterium]